MSSKESSSIDAANGFLPRFLVIPGIEVTGATFLAGCLIETSGTAFLAGATHIRSSVRRLD